MAQQIGTSMSSGQRKKSSMSAGPGFGGLSKKQKLKLVGAIVVLVLATLLIANALGLFAGRPQGGSDQPMAERDPNTDGVPAADAPPPQKGSFSRKAQPLPPK